MSTKNYTLQVTSLTLLTSAIAPSFAHMRSTALDGSLCRGVMNFHPCSHWHSVAHISCMDMLQRSHLPHYVCVSPAELLTLMHQELCAVISLVNTILSNTLTNMKVCSSSLVLTPPPPPPKPPPPTHHAHVFFSTFFFKKLNIVDGCDESTNHHPPPPP